MSDKVKFKKTHPDAKIPTRAYEDAAMWDVYAVESVDIPPGEGRKVPIGLKIELPPKWVCLVFTRSGHGFKGLRVHLGVIDPDYRGDISPYIFNHSKWTFHFSKGSRVAQLFFTRIPGIEVVEADALSETQRGERGFGSSGA